MTANDDMAVTPPSLGLCTGNRRSAGRVCRRGAAIDRRPRPCLHKRAQHRHGTRACYIRDDCRCVRCVQANTDYESRRRRLIAEGEWQPFTDAGPVVVHLQTLIEAGMQRKEVARRADVPIRLINRLLPDERRSDGAPQSHGRLRPQFAHRLLAVRSPAAPVGSALIDATGTHRRLQALVAIGWPTPELGRRLGRRNGDFDELLAQEKVSSTVAVSVSSLYEQLWDCPPPAGSERERTEVGQARAYAQERGWAPPMAWDDELNPIDDPAAEPDFGKKVRPSKLPPGDDLLFLIEAGESVELLAARFGVKKQTARQAVRRARRAAQVPDDGADASSVSAA
jgi:hypothetical protein